MSGIPNTRRPATLASLARLIAALESVQGHDLGEAEFLTELARRTGCRLLVDVNNVFVSAANLGFSAQARLEAIPADLIGEIHLAGHSQDADPESALLIDSHDAPVAPPVWAPAPVRRRNWCHGWNRIWACGC